MYCTKRHFIRISIALSIFFVATQVLAAWTPLGPVNVNATVDSVDDSGDPRIATDGNGRWVAVWRRLSQAAGSTYDIMAAYSLDNGATWAGNAPVTMDSQRLDYTPDIATDGNGKWVCVWCSSLGPDWDLLVSSSADGQTWSQPAALHQAFLDNTIRGVNPRIATDGKGAWIVVWPAPVRFGSPYEDSLYFSRSVDNAATWTAPQPLQSGFMSSLGYARYPSICTDAMGNWIVAWEAVTESGSDLDTYTWSSTDQGQTWTSAVAVNGDAVSDVLNETESSLATDRQGTWMLLRSAVQPEMRYAVVSVVSRDNGLSWSPPVRVSPPRASSPYLEDKRPSVVTDEMGRWVAVWTHSSGELPANYWTISMLASTSLDSGETWSPPEIVQTADPRIELGTLPQVPALATDMKGRYLAVWDSKTLPGNFASDSDILFATTDYSIESDVNIVKQGSLETAVQGQTMSYTLSVGNSGPSTASGVEVLDELPAGCELVSATASQGDCEVFENKVLCDLGRIARNSMATVQIVARLVGQGTIVNTASAVAAEADPDGSNNVSSATVEVAAGPGPDLAGEWARFAVTRKGSGYRARQQLRGYFVWSNKGDRPMPRSVLRFVLSNDDVFDASDLLILRQQILPASRPGTARVVQFSALLAAGQSATGKYVLAVLDATNAATERDEANNVVVFGPIP